MLIKQFFILFVIVSPLYPMKRTDEGYGLDMLGKKPKSSKEYWAANVASVVKKKKEACMYGTVWGALATATICSGIWIAREYVAEPTVPTFAVISQHPTESDIACYKCVCGLCGALCGLAWASPCLEGVCTNCTKACEKKNAVAPMNR